MRRWRLAFLLVMGGLVACTGVSQDVEGAQESQSPPSVEVNVVSIIQLVATPDKYDRHYVRVIGYVRLDFEGNAIYLSEDDERYAVYKNGLWLDVPETVEANAKQYDGKFCLIEGTFNAANHGHMGMWSGAVENIQRFQVRERIESASSEGGATMTGGGLPEIPEELPDHESGLRRMYAESHGQQYHALRTLEEAKSSPDGVVILEGDYGGQIYVVVPASLVKCTEQDLKQLLNDLDALEWSDASGARVYYERHPVGSGVPGGMGGATVTQDIWIHKNFVKLRLDSAIREVIEGKRKTLKG